jgi:hypothetical protein
MQPTNAATFPILFYIFSVNNFIPQKFQLTDFSWLIPKLFAIFAPNPVLIVQIQSEIVHIPGPNFELD